MADSADLMGIGAHCALPDCRQRDFLPFTCDCCRRTFCLEHRTYAAHACAAAGSREQSALVCPLCAQAIKLAPGEDANVAFERHTRDACEPANYARVHHKPRCPVAGCKEKLTSVNRYCCKDCSTVVCLKHRFPSDHKCPGRAASAAAAAGSRQTLTAAVKKWWAPTPTPAKPAPAKPAAAKPVRPPGAQAQQRPAAQPRPAASAGGSGTGDSELCQQCGARLESVAQLISHCEAHHQQQQQAGRQAQGGGGYGTAAHEQCPHCGQAFADPVALVAHVERAHSGGSASACVLC